MVSLPPWFWLWPFKPNSQTFSHWTFTRIRGLRSLPATFLTRNLSIERMGFRDDHSNACPWYPVFDRLRALREISLQEIFHSLLSSEDTLGCGRMLVGDVPFHQLLVGCSCLTAISDANLIPLSIWDSTFCMNSSLTPLPLERQPWP